MIIDYATKVDIGTKETNDDRMLIDGTIINMSSQNGSIEIPTIAVVCDGCGGYLGGNIAAQSVLEVISHEEVSRLSDVSYLSQVLNNCEVEVAKKKSEMPEYPTMCTTIAGCIFYDDITIIFHSGDSRVYRHDRWGIARMTKDHSVVQEMIDEGELTTQEAQNHPKRNVISRCIGIDGRPPEIYVSHTPINPGEKYLLCSDGLWESVSDAEIQEILGSELSLQQAADELVQLALQKGSDDNISVCICSREGATTVQENKPFILD